MFKCKSKIFAFLFVAVLVLAVLPGLKVKADEVKSGTCGAEEGGKNLTWTFDESTKTLTISGKGKMADYDVEYIEVIPWNSYKSDISSILISDGVTSIGNYAFLDCYVTNITIPNSVTLIGKHAFFMCSNFTSVTIPNSVKTIDFCAFEYCSSLSSITIPKSVETIGGYAFSNCSNLTSVTMDRSLKPQCDSNFVFEDCPSDLAFTYYTNYITYDKVDNGKVSGAESLAEIGQTINLTVTPDTGYAVKEVTYTANGKTNAITPDSSGNYSFSMPSCDTTVSASFILSGYCGAGVDRKKLTWTFDESTGILTISGEGEMEKYTNGGAPWYSYRTSIKEIEIVHGVTSISPNAFLDCTNLTSITIPNSVTSIGMVAFNKCSNLKSVTIPNSVTSIGLSAFQNCTSLESVTIPNSVTSIESFVFDSCTNLTSIIIPNSVTSIGTGAFNKCSSLKSVTIPNSVTSIGNNAFFQCSSLTNINIPNSVTSIGTGAFGFCKRLTSVTMDKSLKLQCDSKSVFDFCSPNLTFNYYTYDITYADAKNGTVSGKDKSPSTDNITLTVTPDTNYVVDKVTVTDSKVTKTIERDASGNYSFEMPSEAVKVEASFKLDSKTVTFESDDGKVLQSITVDYGTSPKYTEAEPAKQDDNDYTYTFAGWKNGTNTYGPKDVLPAVTADITYTAVFNGTAKPKPGTYYLDGISEKDGNIIITVKQTEDDTKTYDLLGTVSSDGTLLTEGTQYTTARGSAIITIQKSYVETLAAGIHKLDVTFTDGGSISINYEVKAAAQSGAANVPATGEGFAAATAIGSIMIIVSCGFIVTVLLRKRRENI